MKLASRPHAVTWGPPNQHRLTLAALGIHVTALYGAERRRTRCPRNLLRSRNRLPRKLARLASVGGGGEINLLAMARPLATVCAKAASNGFFWSKYGAGPAWGCRVRVPMGDRGATRVVNHGSGCDGSRTSACSESGQQIATRSQGARTTRRPHYDSQLYRVREQHEVLAVVCNRRLHSHIAPGDYLIVHGIHRYRLQSGLSLSLSPVLRFPGIRLGTDGEISGSSAELYHE